jgi:hypothetical protein
VLDGAAAATADLAARLPVSAGGNAAASTAAVEVLLALLLGGWVVVALTWSHWSRQQKSVKARRASEAWSNLDLDE